VGEHDNAAYVAGNFGATSHRREMTNQHSDQNTDANCLRAGLQYGLQDGTARCSHHSGRDSLQSKLAGLGRRKIGDDDRSKERINRLFEPAGLRKGDRQPATKCRP